MNPYEALRGLKHRGQSKLAVLIDPDRSKLDKLDEILLHIAESKVEWIFLGGSFIFEEELDFCVKKIKLVCPQAKLILFPGAHYYVHSQADALLFLSLISGRNPNFLIGQQVLAAPKIRAAQIDTVSCGYMLVDGGKVTAAHYISNTQPIPSDQLEIALSTALAAQYFNFQTLYLDAGSGAIRRVSPEMIQIISNEINCPLIVGGGISSPEQVLEAASSGATLVVVGTTFESQPEILRDMHSSLESFNL